MHGAGAASAAADSAMALVVFGLGAIAFRFRVLGGGDVKLLAASALWLGLGEIGAFLLATAFFGGLLALIFLGWQMLRPRPKFEAAQPALCHRHRRGRDHDHRPRLLGLKPREHHTTSG